MEISIHITILGMCSFNIEEGVDYKLVRNQAKNGAPSLIWCATLMSVPLLMLWREKLTHARELWRERARWLLGRGAAQEWESPTPKCSGRTGSSPCNEREPCWPWDWEWFKERTRVWSDHLCIRKTLNNSFKLSSATPTASPRSPCSSISTPLAANTLVPPLFLLHEMSRRVI